MTHTFNHLSDEREYQMGRCTILRKILPFSVVVMSLAMTGCANNASVVHISTVENVQPTQSAIFPPPGGPSIITVLERDNPDGMQQTILLSASSATPGDSYFKIRLSSGLTENENAPDPQPIRNRADLDRELLAAFPGTTMVPSGTILQNVFGPFSYASGQGVGGEACVYAWQQITSAGDHKSPLMSLGRIQIRFRMCDAQRSERDLLMVMYGFTITAAVNSKGWNPYGTTVPTQTVAPLSDGIVLPARAATVCERGAAPGSECIFAPEQAPARLAIAESPAAVPRSAAEVEPAPAVEIPAVVTPSEAAPISASAPSVPLPPTRSFAPSVPSSSSPEVPVPPPNEVVTNQPAAPVAEVPAVPSPSSLANAETAGAQPVSASSQAGETSRSKVPPPRVIELSALPSSLRPNATTVEAACKANEGKVCPQ